jgi:hypothetical protein
MALNIWNKDSGYSFGLFQERTKLSLDLPVSSGSGINFELISGLLPPGLRVSGSQIVGTPFEVPRTTTFKFCVRASAANEISDRTFSIDIAGTDDPSILTPAGDLPVGPNSSYFLLDSSYIEFQISAIDFDTATGQQLHYFIAENDGELPTGLSLSDDGIISGFVPPALSIKTGDGDGSYDQGFYDNVVYDFGTRSSNGYNSFLYDQLFYDYSTPTNPPKKVNRNYEFIISVTDGDTVARRKFRVFVVADDFFRADNTYLPAGTGVYKADGTFLRSPVWKTPEYLGIVRANNYVTRILDIYEPGDQTVVIYSFDAEVNWASATSYLVGNKVLYLNKTYICKLPHTSGATFNENYWTLQSLPPGMEFDLSTAEIFGNVPYQPAVTKRYTFCATATRFGNQVFESAVTNKIFYIDVQGEVDSVITWDSNADLGTIPANFISNLRIDATTTVEGAQLVYLLEGGRLPPGLSLMPDGEIVGKVNQYGTFDTPGLTRFFDTDFVRTASSTVFTSSNASPMFGSNLVLTADVTPITAIGRVAFKDGNTVIGYGTLTNGVAEFITSKLSLGAHNLGASYEGNLEYAPSNSLRIPTTVGYATVYMSLSANTLSTSYGGQITLTSTVTSSSGFPTGTILFYDGATVIGTATINNGQASLSIRSLTIGTHTLSSVYSGNANFDETTSNSLTAEIIAQTGTTPSSMILSFNTLTPQYKDTVTITASLTPNTGTGVVIFRDGTTPIGSSVVNSGVAVFSTTLLSGGTHSVNAIYSGSSSLASYTTASTTVIVSKLATAVSFVSSTLIPDYGNAFVLSATITSISGIPTGTVTFKEGVTTIGTSTMLNGTAIFTTTNRVPVGIHSYTAYYNGDTNYATSFSYDLEVTVKATAVPFNMATISSSATSAELGGARDVQYATWTITPSTIQLKGSGLPYHSHGNVTDVEFPTDQNYNITWTYRAGKNLAGADTPTGLGIIGFWINGSAMFNPSAGNEVPTGFSAVSGFHYNASSEQGSILDYSFGEDAAGGSTSAQLAYHYRDGNFLQAWVSGNGGTLPATGIAEIVVIPYLNDGLVHASGHSKILGFAADGYPVYGPFGYMNPTNSASGVRRMTSGYRLKNSSYRAGTAASNLTLYPMGIFVEDFEYLPSPPSDLDDHNGRYCVTPDFPNGTYAYFISVDLNDNPVFPYIIGNTFYGTPSDLGGTP